MLEYYFDLFELLINLNLQKIPKVINDRLLYLKISLRASLIVTFSDGIVPFLSTPATKSANIIKQFKKEDLFINKETNVGSLETGLTF